MKSSGKLTFEEMREVVGRFLSQRDHHSERFWDLLTGLRGPDSPSERPDMSPREASEAYAARRERKRRTVEVIRGRAFNGVVGGSARVRTDRDYVELPPMKEWDHFDKHVERAAAALGLGVQIMDGDVVGPRTASTPEKKPVEIRVVILEGSPGGGIGGSPGEGSKKPKVKCATCGHTMKPEWTDYDNHFDFCPLHPDYEGEEIDEDDEEKQEEISF